MKTTKEIAKQFIKHKNITQSRLNKQYSNTKKCQSFYAGDFMSYQDKIDFTDVQGEKKKALVKFNKVKPYVNAVKGFMAQNRRKPKYEARIQNDKLQELFTGYANAILGYARDNANADQVETQQDGDMLINGYGWVETALTYGEGYATSEADGEYIKGQLDPLAVGWDPHAKQTNLLDRRWDYYAREYHIDDAKKLFSRTDDEDFEPANGDDGQNAANYEYFPYGGNYDKIAPLEWTNEEENMVKVYFYQWYDIEPYYKVANPLYEIEDPTTLQAVDIFLQILAEKTDDESFDPRAEVLCYGKDIAGELEEYFGDMLGDVFEFKRKVFYEAIISGESVFDAYKSISQQGFRRQCKTGDYDSANGIWTGMVNSMMEPVLYYNKALTELMFTIAANSKGGVFYEESAVKDIQEFEENYSKTDAAIEVEDGALSGGKIKEKAKAQLPTGLNDIIGMSDQAVTDVNGFDVTFMGSREFANDTASFQRQRIKQAMSLLACYFDAAALYQKIDARVSLDLLRVFVENNENMTIRVIGEEGQAMFLALQTKQLSAEYDVVISEAPMTVQDKQEQATIFISMGDKMAATGDIGTAKAIYAKAVELMPLDFAMKESLKQVLEPQEQEAVDPAYVKQLETIVQQLQDEGRQAQLRKTIASADLDVARAEETLAKVDKTRAETTDTLEDARNKGLENDIIRSGTYTEAKVTI